MIQISTKLKPDDRVTRVSAHISSLTIYDLQSLHSCGKCGSWHPELVLDTDPLNKVNICAGLNVPGNDSLTSALLNNWGLQSERARLRHHYYLSSYFGAASGEPRHSDGLRRFCFFSFTAKLVPVRAQGLGVIEEQERQLPWAAWLVLLSPAASCLSHLWLNISFIFTHTFPPLH